ncbi:MAG: hypothetical protein GC134_03210 [Proteobacteria bacterium]|nr:hypothetical protein [Pseudomonadota bacterium]
MSNDININAEYLFLTVPADKLATAARYWGGLEVLVDGAWMRTDDPELDIHTEGLSRTRYGYKRRERVAVTKNYSGPFSVRINLKANPAVRALLVLQK